MKTKTRVTFEKVRFDQENEIHAVVELQAPKLDWQNKRPPICIIPVVDISGSMCGPKLDYAKKSVLKLVDHLKPGDWCGLVAFESTVHKVFKPREMAQAQKEKLKHKVGNLSVMGCTDFSGGMLAALDWVKKLDLPESTQIRVIMFTDGHANQGVATDLAGLSKLLKARKGRATLSAFGYGEDADQDLLAELAKQGEENYAFIRNPEEALTAFARELGGLLSTYATDIKVTVSPTNGHKISEVLSDVDSEEKGNGICINIPNIFSEEEVNLVLGMALSEQKKAFPRKSTVAKVEVVCQRLCDSGEVLEDIQTSTAKVRFVKPGEEQKEPTKEVDDIVSLAQLVQAQIAAEEQAKAGNFEDAQGVMQDAQYSLYQKGQLDVASVAALLGEKMVDSQVYARSGGYLNSAKGIGTRACSVVCSDMGAEADFAALGVKGSTSAQDDMVHSFTGGSSTPDPVVSNKDSAFNQALRDLYSQVGDQMQDAQRVEAVQKVASALGLDADAVQKALSEAAPQPEPPKPSSVSKSKSSRW